MASPYTKIFVKNFSLEMFIGIYEQERAAKQTVIVNVEALLRKNVSLEQDDITEVVSYEDIVKAIPEIAEKCHINLLETFAEKIAAFCLQDQRIENVIIRVEKPNIFAAAESVGVEISRP